MPTLNLLDFDPYRTWLNVTDAARPLSAYAILRLPPLEDKEPRIRMAFR